MTKIDAFAHFSADTAMFGASHAVRCAVEFFGSDHAGGASLRPGRQLPSQSR